MLYLLVYQDGRGERFQPLDYLDRLALVANRPIYSWVDSTLDHGVLGGRMLRQGADIQAVAALVLRVLRGERADAIPISEFDGSVDLIDWRQLRRWRISEARVPAGTLVLYREPGIWDRNKGFRVWSNAPLVMFWSSAPDRRCVDFNQAWLDFTGRSRRKVDTGGSKACIPTTNVGNLLLTACREHAHLRKAVHEAGQAVVSRQSSVPSR